MMTTRLLVRSAKPLKQAMSMRRLSDQYANNVGREYQDTNKLQAQMCGLMTART